MLAKVHSFVLQGIEAVKCEVEVNIAAKDYGENAGVRSWELEGGTGRASRWVYPTGNVSQHIVHLCSSVDQNRCRAR